MFAATGPQFDDRRPFGTLAFRKGLEDRNFDFRFVIGNHCYTSRRNLVRFGLMTPELIRHKKLYSRRQKCFWGDFRYVRKGSGLLDNTAISK